MIQRTHDRAHVAWDIETTGFGWDDEITVTGFWYPDGHADLILNTNGTDFDSEHAERQLHEASSGVEVTVTTTPDEAGLLAALQDRVFECFDREYNRLVAFNAEAWKGGFDLPFLRTRCFNHNISWPFRGLQFADLWDPLKKRMNTTHTAHGTSTSVNSLTGAHDLIFPSVQSVSLDLSDETRQAHTWYAATPYDPLSDSGEAVVCYDNGEFEPILQHNLADVHRTWELGELIRTYVAPKDLQTKKL